MAPSKPASNAVADAYKNYLYKAMPSYSAEDFAAGKPIPVDQVDRDIAILENKIRQYEKFGFSADTEKQQLVTLTGFKENVKGKHWPSKQVSDPKKETGGHTSGKSVYYSKAFVDPLKYKPTGTVVNPYVQEPVATKLTMQAGRALVDQEFIMRMGMQSNCNVSIERLMGSGHTERTALLCRSCGETYPILEKLLVVSGNDLPNMIGKFCTDHRHDAKVSDKTGRMFREENE